jgi:serine protease Do
MVLVSAALVATTALAGGDASYREVISQVQPKIVKIYGAGELRGLDAYQSGFLISPQGHILTVWSTVLDTDVITVLLNDGRKFEAKLLGADPRLEAALLKIEATDLPAFDLTETTQAEVGTRVLAFSNLFGVATGNEPVSVQHGTIAVRTELAARRGVFETPYHGPVYVLDMVTNNPGAGGGALVTWRGQLVAMLGKELRNRLNNTWLNYAVPLQELQTTVDEIRAGRFVARQEDAATKKPARPLTLDLLGIRLVPDVLPRTPPYVDSVIPGSLAARAGIHPDDLILLLGDHLIQNCKVLRSELESIDFEDQIKLTVRRGQDLQDFVLQAKQ